MALLFSSSRGIADPLSEKYEGIEWASGAHSGKYATGCISGGRVSRELLLVKSRDLLMALSVTSFFSHLGNDLSFQKSFPALH